MSLRTSLAVSAIITITACSSGTQSSTANAPSPANASASALPAGVTPLMVAAGDSIFKANSCARCHGPDAKGRQNGSDLTDAVWSQISGTYPEIVQIILDGVPKEKVKLATAQFAMRPRGGTNLSDEQIRQVAAYVYSISHR